MAVLTNLVMKNYDFPVSNNYIIHQLMLEPPLEFLKNRQQQRKKTTPSKSALLGGSIARLDWHDRRTDTWNHTAYIWLTDYRVYDWILDTFMEEHRMKCWVAVQGKTRRWSEKCPKGRSNDFRSPYSKISHFETLSRVLTNILTGDIPSLLTHEVLRTALIGNNEAIPPTVEFYLQTISKLNPSSIYLAQITYGVSLAAVIAANNPLCLFSLRGLREEAAQSLREFVNHIDGGSSSYLTETTQTSSSADLIFLDIIPYGTHDLRAYLGENSTPKTLSYVEHLHRFVLTPLRQLIISSDTMLLHPTRVAIVTSLRELSVQPTIEPMLLTIMADEQLSKHFRLIGALNSRKRDYAAYLLLMYNEPQENPPSPPHNLYYRQQLDRLYPELAVGFPTTRLVADVKSIAVQKPSRETWEVQCLRALKASSSWIEINPQPAGRISLQGPRTLKNKEVFPSRNRKRHIIREEKLGEDIVFVFGSIISEPPLREIAEVPQSSVEINDPLIARMVSNIRESLRAATS